MKPKDKKAFIIYVLLSLVLWQLCVSLSKIITKQYIKADDLIFSVVETTNKGAAFGLFNDNPYVLGTLGTIVLVIVLFYVYKNVKFEDKTKILSCAVFTSGILGNTAERFNNGYVTDFIKLNFFDFPVFNLYDILITVSVFMYLFYCIKEEAQKRKKN
ncbi:MAG: signal peptidase II [bacterium]|nr:signal peptidase II [bacterium]